MSDPISRFDLGLPLDARGVPDNPWISMIQLDARPPAPFRVKNLYATAIELRRPGLPDDQIEEEIRMAQTMGSAIRDVGLNQLPNLRRVDQVDGLDFDSMFFEIYEELPNWIVWGGKPRLTS